MRASSAYLEHVDDELRAFIDRFLFFFIVILLIIVIIFHLGCPDVQLPFNYELQLPLVISDDEILSTVALEVVDYLTKDVLGCAR